MARTRGVEGGGKVEGLPVHTFPTDDGDVAMKCPTEIAITDRREFELVQPRLPAAAATARARDFAVFMGAQSARSRRSTAPTRPTPTPSCRRSFTYHARVSRFAHYLKVMGRDKIGSFMERKDVEDWLSTWISNYVLLDDKATQDQKAKYPLREARVEVTENKGKPGAYKAVFYLRPHFQLEELTMSMRLVSEVPKKK